MKKTNMKVIFALLFAICMTLQLSIGVLAARDAVGDLDGNGIIDKDDAIHLLGNTIFESLYPVDQPVDYNHDGIVDKEDALYLLGHTIFSDLYYICQHETEKWSVSGVVLPTCNEQGYTVIVCECGETDTRDFVPANAEAHVWEVKDDTNAATCIENGYIVKMCSVCKLEQTIDEIAPGHSFPAVSCTEDAVCETCGAVSVAKGHVLCETAVETVEATCIQDGYKVYKCENCDYTYTEITAPKSGHTVADDAWSETTMRAVDGKECVYVWVETASCSTCSEEVERVSEEFTYHVASVSVIEATCSAVGSKITSCSVCGDSISETEIPVNADAHDWIAAAAEGNAISYECGICHATKKGITASSDAAVDLGEADEVTVGGVTLAPDASASAQLSGEEIYISAENQGAADLGNISDDLAERIGDDPIYDITIKNGSDDEISTFDGWITVSVPYALAEGEDPDNIIVWYIDDSGSVTAIEDVEYRDGYAIFKTNHFSKYCVTRKTSAEICAERGHNYVDSSVPATCASGGYQAERCTRCNSFKLDEEYDALGHDWKVISDKEATCEEAGEVVSECSRCKVKYTTTKAAFGHDYQPEEASGKTDRYKEPTCTEPGEHYIVCTKCGGEYAEALACTGHDDTTRTVHPDCVNAGYTEYTCKICESVRQSDIKLPLGHVFEAGKCTVCEKECEHVFHYGECTICKMDKNNGEGGGSDDGGDGGDDPILPDVHEHRFEEYTVDFGCPEHRVVYTKCSCGTIDDITLNEDSFDQISSDGQNAAVTCSQCGLSVVLRYEYGEKDASCNVVVTCYVEIHQGDHVEKMSASWTETDHDYEEIRLEVGCPEHNITYDACACGDKSSIYFAYDTFLREDDHSNETYFCENCAVRIELYNVESEKNDKCQYTTTCSEDVYCGNTLVYEYAWSYEATDHDYIESAELPEGADSCLDGVLITRTCIACGHTNDPYYVYYHYGDVWYELPDVCESHGIEYGECFCGEETYFFFDISTFNCEETDGIEVLTCPSCAARVEMTVSEFATEELCRIKVVEDRTLYFGDEKIACMHFEGYKSRHSIERTVEFVDGATSCLDGVTVAERCTVCEYGYSETYYDHYIDSMTVDGACGEHNVGYGACLCGAEEVIYASLTTFNGYWDGEKWVHSCDRCGVRVTNKYSESDRRDDCTATATQIRELYIGANGGPVFVTTDVYETESHRTSITSAKLVSGATSCLDGVEVIWTCEYCGVSFPSVEYEHVGVETQVDFGCPEHSITVTNCACNSAGSINFEHNSFDNRYYDGEHTYTCENCDVHITVYQTESEKRENCKVTVTKHSVVYFGETVLCDVTDTWEGTSHDQTIVKVELVDGATSCEEGVIVYKQCADCGLSWSYAEMYHTGVSKEVAGACPEHNIYFETCACGEKSWISFSRNTFECTMEGNSEHCTCPNCDVRIDVNYVVSTTEGCQITEIANYVITNDAQTETYAVITEEYVYTSHTREVVAAELMEGSTSCLDGVTVTYRCSKCDAEPWTVNAFYHLAINETITAGCEDHCVTARRCACGANSDVSFDNSTFRYNYTSYENGYSRLYTCDECGLAIEERKILSEKNEQCECIATYTETVKLGEKTLFESVSESSSISHNYATKELLDEWSDVTNGDGTRTVTEVSESYCADCLASLEKNKCVYEYDAAGLLATQTLYAYTYVPVSETENDAVLNTETLTEYSYIAIEGVADPVRVTARETFKRWNGYGELTFTRTSEYTRDAENPCLVTEHLTNSNGIDETYEPYTQHLYTLIKYVLSEGSVTCNDGVDMVRCCAACGEKIGYGGWTSAHVSNFDDPEWIIDLTEYGSVCDEEVIIDTCLCGSSLLAKLPEDADFEIYSTYRNIDGVGHSYRIYKCAVTDPVACGFTFVTDVYATTDDECYVTYHNDVYFGVDMVAKTYASVLEGPTVRDGKEHPDTVVEHQETENSYIETYTCTKCGQLVRTIEYAKDGNTATRTYSNYDALTGEYVVEKNIENRLLLPEYGTEVMLLDRSEYYNAEGELTSWINSEFTYPNSESGDYCNYVRVYTNSNGIKQTYTGTSHCAQTEHTIYRNCVEAIIKIVCRCCGEERETRYYTNHQFRFDKEKGLYVCGVCGMENADGANGDVNFVDVTSEGDGTKYIVNYSNRYGYDYTWSVRIVADGLDSPIVVPAESYTDVTDERRLYIDVEAVRVLAAENGLDTCAYTLEVAFVPTNAGASLVYSAFIDSHIYLYDEEKSVIPEGGCSSENPTQIVHTCQICGESKTEVYSDHYFAYVGYVYETTTDENGDVTTVDADVYECRYCGASYIEGTKKTVNAAGQLIYEEKSTGLYSFEKRTYLWHNGKQYPLKIETYHEIYEYEYKFNDEEDVCTATCIHTSSYSQSPETVTRKFRISDGRVLFEEFVNGSNTTTDEYEYDDENDRYTRTFTCKINGVNVNGITVYTYKISDGLLYAKEEKNSNGVTTSKYAYDYVYLEGYDRPIQYTVRFEDSKYIQGYAYEFNTSVEGRYTKTTVETTKDNEPIYESTAVHELKWYLNNERYYVLSDNRISETGEYSDGRKYTYSRVEEGENFTETAVTTYPDGSIQTDICEYDAETGMETRTTTMTYPDGREEKDIRKYNWPNGYGYYGRVLVYEYSKDVDGNYSEATYTSVTWKEQPYSKHLIETYDCNDYTDICSYETYEGGYTETMKRTNKDESGSWEQWIRKRLMAGSITEEVYTNSDGESYTRTYEEVVWDLLGAIRRFIKTNECDEFIDIYEYVVDGTSPKGSFTETQTRTYKDSGKWEKWEREYVRFHDNYPTSTHYSNSDGESYEE